METQHLTTKSSFLSNALTLVGIAIPLGLGAIWGYNKYFKEEEIDFVPIDDPVATGIGLSDEEYYAMSVMRFGLLGTNGWMKEIIRDNGEAWMNRVEDIINNSYASGKRPPEEHVAAFEKVVFAKELSIRKSPIWAQQTQTQAQEQGLTYVEMLRKNAIYSAIQTRIRTWEEYYAKNKAAGTGTGSGSGTGSSAGNDGADHGGHKPNETFNGVPLFV